MGVLCMCTVRCRCMHVWNSSRSICLTPLAHVCSPSNGDRSTTSGSEATFRHSPMVKHGVTHTLIALAIALNVTVYCAYTSHTHRHDLLDDHRRIPTLGILVMRKQHRQYICRSKAMRALLDRTTGPIGPRGDKGERAHFAIEVIDAFNIDVRLHDPHARVVHADGTDRSTLSDFCECLVGGIGVEVGIAFRFG